MEQSQKTEIGAILRLAKGAYGNQLLWGSPSTSNKVSCNRFATVGHEERQGFGMWIDLGLLLSLGGEINGENMARLMAKLQRAYGEKINPRSCQLA
jgi:hypothetical protein